MTASEKSRTRRVEIFRSEGTPLSEDVMSSEGVDESVMAGFGKLLAAGGGTVEVERTQCLFRSPEDNGFSLVHAWFKSNFVLPRHSHNTDCLYYVVGGELRMGTTVLRKGDGFFVPGGKGYTYEAGPDGVEILEFRDVSHYNILYKGNDDAHWDRMANAFRENVPRWADETTPPSDRNLKTPGDNG